MFGRTESNRVLIVGHVHFEFFIRLDGIAVVFNESPKTAGIGPGCSVIKLSAMLLKRSGHSFQTNVLGKNINYKQHRSGRV